MVWMSMGDEQTYQLQLLLIDILRKTRLLALARHTCIDDDSLTIVVDEQIGALAIWIEIKCLEQGSRSLILLNRQVNYKFFFIPLVSEELGNRSGFYIFLKWL